MVPVHVLVAPAGTPSARSQLCHCPKERLACEGVNLCCVSDIGIEKRKLVGAKIILEGECQIPADAPVNLELWHDLHIILEIRRHVTVPQVGVARTTPALRGNVPEQEARESISGIYTRSSFSGVSRYVGGKIQRPRSPRLARGAAGLKVILVSLSDIDTDIHGVPAIYIKEIAQEGIA